MSSLLPALVQSGPEAAMAAVDSGGGGALALLVLIAVALAWIGLRLLVRRLRAGKTELVVHGEFHQYALAALVNAAKLDGRLAEVERAAILAAMREIAGAGYEAGDVTASFAADPLSKDDLVAYLAIHASKFSHAQKTALLKALLTVFVADGRFDEAEHHALVDYTAAIGFDRKSAPERLRTLVRDMVKDKITL
jgi:uncharacterized membrane protein YebE (DUF533 family)